MYKYIPTTILLLLLDIGSSSALPNSLQAQAPLLSHDFGPSRENARTNAPAVFNAIHSSMRQWGSSLQHNGMSFYLASIPEGVMLYHGTHTPERVEGMEWLAFEIEHAENFARSRSGRGPGGPGRGPPGKGPGGKPGDGGRKPPGEDQPGSGPPFLQDDSFYALNDKDEDRKDGYLHMYRTTRPAKRLLYIDGMSAGKTNLGTLDSQDKLLLNFTDGGGRGFGERERGLQLCEWGKEYALEGFIRTEAGIEIIWCEFLDGLEFVSHNRRPSLNDPANSNGLSTFEYYRAMSARYHGITAQRVNIDYSSMVSAFFYPVNLSNPDPARAPLPRLTSTSDVELQAIKADLENVLARETSYSSVDWQGVVDMIVTRYNTRLPFLATKATKSAMISETNTLLNVFVDYNATDIDSAINQCTKHYLRAITPSTDQDFLIVAALEKVSHQICRTLFQVREIVLSEADGDEEEAEKPAPVAAVRLLEGLMEYLDWTDWKRCGTCAYDEVCVVAIWPFGTVEDHTHPSCKNSSQLDGMRGGPWRGDGYWHTDF